jgi:hypothetical protein
MNCPRKRLDQAVPFTLACSAVRDKLVEHAVDFVTRWLNDGERCLERPSGPRSPQGQRGLAALPGFLSSEGHVIGHKDVQRSGNI